MVKEGGIFSRFDAKTGALGTMARIGEPDEYFASPVAAGGRILTASKSGQLTVIDAGAAWEVVSTGTIDEEIWSTPAVDADRVYLRTQSAVIAYDTGPDG